MVPGQVMWQIVLEWIVSALPSLTGNKTWVSAQSVNLHFVSTAKLLIMHWKVASKYSRRIVASFIDVFGATWTKHGPQAFSEHVIGEHSTIPTS